MNEPGFHREGREMISVLAGRDLRIEYLRDPLAIEALDEERIVENLTAGTSHPGASGLLGRRLLTDFDHVAVASGGDGRACALLAARDGKTTREEFLLIEVAFVRPDARGAWLMRRMMATMMLRIAGLAPVPTVIAARISDPAWLAELQQFSASFTGAAFYPQASDAPIQLRTAALAQRIAREMHPGLRFEAAMGALRGSLAGQGVNTALDAPPGATMQPVDQLLAIIDLRTETETVIVDDARRVLKGRG